MNIKEQYRRFRAWQKEPQRYKDKGLDRQSTCINCGHTHEGNYCPVCGQRSDQGRITWGEVWKSILNVWGMDSRSMPISLLQLLLRPGHFISEFINGRRQVSYAPVNMLFATAVIYVIAGQIFGLKTDRPLTSDNDDIQVIVRNALNWMGDNPAWAAMAMTTMMLIPTWFLFHHSPRNTHHTLPQGIFIQLFMSSLALILLVISNFIPSFLSTILIPFYYYACYRQLFGYGVWSTLWRIAVCMMTWFILLTAIIASVFIIGDSSMPSDAKGYGALFIFIVPIGTVAAILAIGYRIGHRTESRRNR